MRDVKKSEDSVIIPPAPKPKESLAEDVKVEARKLGITIASQREALKAVKGGHIGFIQNLQNDADRITQYILEGSLLTEEERKI